MGLVRREDGRRKVEGGCDRQEKDAGTAAGSAGRQWLCRAAVRRQAGAGDDSRRAQHLHRRPDHAAQELSPATPSSTSHGTWLATTAATAMLLGDCSPGASGGFFSIISVRNSVTHASCPHTFQKSSASDAPCGSVDWRMTSRLAKTNKTAALRHASPAGSWGGSPDCDCSGSECGGLWKRDIACGTASAQPRTGAAGVH